MKILALNDIILLKNILAEEGAEKIHLHDTCGGQCFTLENPDEKTEYLIQTYLSKKGLKAIFSDDRLGFVIDTLK